MPNWYSNRVEFTGDATLHKKLKKLFDSLRKREIKTQQGQFPDFVQAASGWMHEIRYEENALYYETKWCPNHEIVLAVARHFNCGFNYSYEETGCLIYGETVYKDSILTERWLTPADFDLYEMPDDCDKYLFEGREYESDYEILEILLERKAFVSAT